MPETTRLDPRALEAALEAYFEQKPWHPAIGGEKQAVFKLLPAALTAYLDALWRPIEEAPKDGRAFMVYVASGEVGPHCFAPVSRDNEGGWWDDSTGDAIEPIKGAIMWCPLFLPQPPKGSP